MLKDKVTETGAMLKMERVVRGLDLHEVANKVRISWYYLEAIERGPEYPAQVLLFLCVRGLVILERKRII
jgi:hypothetical protein